MGVVCVSSGGMWGASGKINYTNSILRRSPSFLKKKKI